MLAGLGGRVGRRGRLLVWYNPQYPDTVRPRPDGGLDVVPLAPLLNVSLGAACAGVLPAGAVDVVAQGPGRKGDGVIVALDYFSAQPAANL